MDLQSLIDLPIPNDRILQVHAFAYDLAFGAIQGYWSPLFEISEGEFIDSKEASKGSDFYKYIWKKWQARSEDDEFGIIEYDVLLHPEVQLMISFGYLEEVDNVYKYLCRLTDKAISLLGKTPPASIFISYNRRQSSAFALLLLSLLKKEGLEAFLDIRSIAPGDDWHGLIEGEVKKRENFIVLLNRTTLKSKYVRQEIRWAIEKGSSKRIIPIFHGGLKPKNFKDDEFQELLAKNAIVVEQETAIAYESALLQLLNYFGRTP